MRAWPPARPARRRLGCWSARWSSPVPIWSCSRICTEGGDRVAEEKQRIIQEFVPGKQVTLAHIIANPVDDLFKKLGVVGDNLGAIGILTITPSEAAIIAGDVASKAAGVSLAFVDRFSGSVVISGDVESVEASLNAVMDVLSGTLQFTPAPITKT
ncbi:BMC domain-containing protein [Flavonifractor plautii]|nr:BMC domain-containing protein [Flavonifractor plautii]